MMSDSTNAKLRTIRAAGLNRVKRKTLKMGVTTLERDFKILRDVANGSVPQAAEKSGCCQATVIRVLQRYEAIALALIQHSRKEKVPGETGKTQEESR